MQSVYLKNLKENLNVELKEAVDDLPKNIYETYSSFANTSGGKIYLGIKEVKESNKENIILGVNNASKMKSDFFNTINSSKVSVVLGGDEIWKEIIIDNKIVIEITIKEAPKELKPVYLNGNKRYTYIRRNDGDYLADENRIFAFELDASKTKFDSRPNTINILYEDLNKDTLKKYRNRFNQVNKDNSFMNLEDKDFFFSIGALKRNNEGKIVPTNAAIMLFGSYLMIKDIFPNYNLDYQENITKSSRWDYRFEASSLSWSGNVFDFIINVMSKITPYLPNKFKIGNNYEDIGDKIALEIVREGIANAINNCDYFLPTGVYIKYEDNTLQIRNAGRMRIPLEQALRGGVSDPRNEGLMNLLHLVRIGDKGGLGIPNMINRAKELNLPEPVFRECFEPEVTILTISFNELKQENENSIRHQKVIECLRENGELSASDISRLTGINRATISLSLSDLISQGIVVDNGLLTKGKKFRLK